MNELNSWANWLVSRRLNVQHLQPLGNYFWLEVDYTGGRQPVSKELWSNSSCLLQYSHFQTDWPTGCILVIVLYKSKAAECLQQLCHLWRNFCFKSMRLCLDTECKEAMWLCVYRWTHICVIDWLITVIITSVIWSHSTTNWYQIESRPESSCCHFIAVLMHQSCF